LTDAEPRSIRQAFRPRARLLQLLGEQLIGSPRLAVFELVKNSYDADADHVKIRFLDLGWPSARIQVSDNGQGMSLETIQKVWLIPGNDHRERQRAGMERSPKHGRLPLGEKGVGRFAAHKLGDRIKVVTRAAGHAECFVDIDWSELLKNEFLDDAEVTVTEREAEIFKGDKTGTVIQISSLRETNWERREIRDLYRQVTSIASPFGERHDSFDVDLEVPDHPEWIRTLPNVDAILNFAPYVFEFLFDGDTFSWSYNFRGVPGVRVERRTSRNGDDALQIAVERELEDLDPASEPRHKRRGRITANGETIEGIGPIRGRFYIFDRDREILSRYGETRFVERYLDQNGGIRVYRDGIRVYNYGEPGDDWLGLDLRRVNAPTRNLSRNIIVGVVDLDLSLSRGLREKTNREGFVEDDALDRFKRLVLGALNVLETERSVDKAKLRAALGGTPDAPIGMEGPLKELRTIANKHGVGSELEPAIRKIEHDYASLRDSYLRSGLSQVGLATVFHEVERGVRMLARTINDPAMTLDRLREQAGQLQGVLESSTQLLRRTDRKRGSLREVIKTARDLNLIRFRLHGIKLTCPALEPDAPDAEPVFASSLVLGAVTNLIDNAIHWMRVRWPEEDTDVGRRLYINVVPDYPEGPAIVVADTGTGFTDDPELLVTPFFTRRAGGSGLGLYFSNLVMQLNDGQLAFPTAEQVDVPEEFDGAIVALVFNKD
jgi:signal transduction histidine kinase